MLNCLLLAECVYRAYDGGAPAAAAALAELAAAFPAGLVTVRRLQCSLPHVAHRCGCPLPAHVTRSGRSCSSCRLEASAAPGGGPPL